MHGGLLARARLDDRVDVKDASDHDVHVRRRGPGDPAQPGREGSAEEYRPDPSDVLGLLGQQDHWTTDDDDLLPRDGQRTVRVAADRPRATHPALDQDARVDQPHHLAVSGRLGQVDVEPRLRR